MPKRILVIQTAFIGDVILATALLESLHKKDPNARIDLLVRKGNESLFKGHPFLNEVLVWDKKSGKYANLFSLLKKIRKSKYDLLVNVQRFAASGFLSMFSGAKKVVGFSKNPLSIFFNKRVPHHIDWHGGETTHEVERNHLLIADEVGSEAERPKLYPTAAHKAEVDACGVSRPYVCIAPASVWFTKQFPVSQWIALTNELTDDFQVLLIGAPSDAEICEEIASHSTHPHVKVLAGKLSLLGSAALMSNASMNYVNDSAPMHLCSALNAPVTAVYCSTIPAFGFGPLSDNSSIVEVQEKLDCRPCGLHGFKKCPEGHFNCAHHIKVEQFNTDLK